MSTKTILYATDYSDASQHALKIAASLARDLKAKLLIVHVSQSEIAPVGELFDEEPEPPPEELAALQAVKPDDPQIECEHRLVFAEPASDKVAHPAEEILKLADTEHVSMVVVGTHGRAGLGRALTGASQNTSSATPAAR